MLFDQTSFDGYVKELNYGCKVDRGKAPGNARVSGTRTTGTAEFSGSVTLYQQGHMKLIDAYGQGWMDKIKSITCVIAKPGLKTLTIVITIAGAAGVDHSSSEGNAPHEAKYDLDVVKYTENNICPVAEGAL